MRKAVLGFVVACQFAAPVAVLAADAPSDPSFLHGLGKTIDGVVLEFPKNVLEGTLDGPPVVGTVMGAFGGIVRAAQKTFEGLIEMGNGFDPWGTKRK